MATKRFGYLDDFSLKNQKVGIGTSTANEKLEVLGGTRGGGAVVTGIATFTSYSGFDNTKFTNTENTNITGGESGTLSREIVVGTGLTMSVGTGATTGQGSIKSLKVSNTFIPPVGTTDERPSAPKPGSFFYNKDFRTLEFWNGQSWNQVNNRGSAGRMLFAGGYDTNPHGAAKKTQIDYFNLSTGGNAIKFGEMTTAVTNTNGCSNSIRGMIVIGYTDGDLMQYVTLASEGNTIDFGNRTVDTYGGQAVASDTRAVFVGGAGNNTIDYVEIMTTGNATDFGDCGSQSFYRAGSQSPIRGVLYAGGYSGTYGSAISSFLISSKGNSYPWGDAASSNHQYVTGQSNSVRGIYSMGGGGPATNNGVTDRQTECFELASYGLGVDFGELAVRHNRPATASSQTRMVVAGGQDATPSPNQIATCESVTIATRGSSEYFGDLTVGRDQFAGMSDCHGGLGGF